MRFGNYALTAAAAIMAVTPAVAAPINPASSLSVSKAVRSGSTATNKEKLAGGGTYIAIIAAVVVIAGIVVIATRNDNPSSR